MAGERVYGASLAAGRISRAEAEPAACLLELGLLHPDPADTQWLVPTNPGQVVSQLMRGIESELSAVRRRAGLVASMAERFAAPTPGVAAANETLRVLEGRPRINRAIDEATAVCTTEMRAMQPSGIRSERDLSNALPRALHMRSNGVRMLSLYTHVARHGQGLQSYLEQLQGSVEVRTLDEVVERLLIFDRTVAFVPASADRSVALEVRAPAMVEFLVTVFDRFWHLAVPLGNPLPTGGGVDGISRREHVIAALLADGHTDAVIAERLGINVRTCRHHIRRLSEALGCATRAQLGVRIAQAGLDRPPR
ncbi:helix-turn-helix transcriptional regulator [Streptomyces indicus]|uniref:Regulatory protein, luxR family n=1 Tax=Streptomyces indicus TaxID=417292 RepID=A0A1G9CGU3_9ACTN|nr:regulatory protein, luxR family [Streptomyces indicus]